MSLYQYSMYFQDSAEGVGWSEQIVQNVTEGVSFFVNTAADALKWAQKRQPFLSTDSEILAVVRRLIGSRATQPFVFSAPVQGTGGTVNEVAEISIDYRLKTATGQSRVYWCRGVPSTWIKSGKLEPPGQDGLAMIDSYFNFLTRIGGIGLRTTDQPKVKANNIANIAPAGNVLGDIQVTVTKWPSGGATVPVDGQLVRITGVRGYPYVAGVWKVASPSGAAGGMVQFTLSNSAKYQGVFSTAGSVQIVNPSSVGFASFGFDRVGRHKCGAIFGRQRGRSSAKVLHSR